MRTPPHLKENMPRLFLIRRWATRLSVAFFSGAPVYLVGSALELSNPRDWDFRVILTAEAFARRYATPAQLRRMTPREVVARMMGEEVGDFDRSSGIYSRWLREMNGINRAAFYRWTGLYTDFQARPLRAARTWRGRPKWRASDSRPAR